MKRVRYTKYTGDLASEMSMEDLLQALSDYLLDSGFRNPFMRFQELDHTLDDLREALRAALESGELFDEHMQEAIDAMAAEGKLDELIKKLLDRLERENLICSGRSRKAADRLGKDRGRFASRSRIRASIFSATRHSATYLDRWVNRTTGATTRATGPPALRQAAHRGLMSSATL